MLAIDKITRQKNYGKTTHNMSLVDKRSLKVKSFPVFSITSQETKEQKGGNAITIISFHLKILDVFVCNSDGSI